MERALQNPFFKNYTGLKSLGRAIHTADGDGALLAAASRAGRSV